MTLTNNFSDLNGDSTSAINVKGKLFAFYECKSQMSAVALNAMMVFHPLIDWLKEGLEKVSVNCSVLVQIGALLVINVNGLAHHGGGGGLGGPDARLSKS